MKRLIVVILTSAAVTFSLFAFMAFIIASDQRVNEPVEPSIPVTITQTPPESRAEKIKRLPVKPPEVKAPPERVSEPVDGPSDAAPTFEFVPPEIATRTSLAMSGFSGMQNGDARPVFRVNPDYPIGAARDGIEGWVILGFDIDEIGGVTNIHIIEAEPKRIFNKEARRALRKWKYNPKVVDGKAIVQRGLRVQLDFTMDQSA